MVICVSFDEHFKKAFLKIKNKDLKNRIITQIDKLKYNPFAGKPMRYARQGTRELYIHPFRLSYVMIKNSIILLELYHKDEQ